MTKPHLIFNSFQTKVTLAFIFSLLLIIGLGNFLLYEYSLKLQFNQFREKLLVIARTASLAIDSSLLSKIPLNYDGLKGDQINIFAQIVTVADAYDAMTSSRSYRPALSKEEAISILKRESGIQFNPKVIEAFIKVLA